MNNEVLWDFYLNFLIQHNSLHALQNQASKLNEHAASLQDWRSSPYGQHIRFCDEKTLQLVRDVWTAYNPEKLSKEANERRLGNMQTAIDRTQTEKILARDGILFGHLQSVAPFAVDSARDSEKLVRKYWSTGTLDDQASDLHPNPIFLLGGDRVLLFHPTPDPLSGFQLATAYATLAGPSVHSTDQYTRHSRIVTAIKGQFFSWMEAFKNSGKDKPILRCFAGDALNLCHTLQRTYTCSSELTAHLYRDQWSFSELHLDTEEYPTAAGCAPTSFDIIETGNLAENAAFFSIVAAVQPLMKRRLTSTLYTQTFASSRLDAVKTMRDLLRCDEATMVPLAGRPFGHNLRHS